MFFLNSHKPILSPCIGICRLDAAGYCEGCARTTDEIAHWISYTDAQREHLMTNVLPQRSEQRGHAL